MAEAHAALAALRAEETSLAARRDEVRRRADYLRHVVTEIDAAKLKPGEDEALAARGAPAEPGRHAGRAGAAHRRRARGRRRERARAPSARPIARSPRWSGSIPAVAAVARAARRRATPTSPSWRGWPRDYAGEVRGGSRAAGGGGAAARPALRAHQKYGATLEAVLATRDASAAELDLLDTADVDLRALGARRAAAEAALRAAADGAHRQRRDAADRLARGVNRLLPQLGLPGGKLAVALRAAGRAGGARRRRRVQFDVQLNVGLEAKPLARVASGGELSRLMLALKVVLVAARRDRRRWCSTRWTRASAARSGAQVGEALAEVAERHQVLVITHLPQIAARADQHLVVSQGGRAAASPPATCRRSTARIASARWRGCWGIRRARRRGGTRRRCCGRKEGAEER